MAGEISSDRFNSLSVMYFCPRSSSASIGVPMQSASDALYAKQIARGSETTQKLTNVNYGNERMGGDSLVAVHLKVQGHHVFRDAVTNPVGYRTFDGG